ncbi:MAG: hypothetical protein ACT4PV_14400 [Planctomycetaceae bacterium]
MLKAGSRAALAVVLVALTLLSGCNQGSPFAADIDAILFASDALTGFTTYGVAGLPQAMFPSIPGAPGDSGKSLAELLASSTPPIQVAPLANAAPTDPVTVLPEAGAGQLVKYHIMFESSSGAPLPDTFELAEGAYPLGLQVVGDGAGGAFFQGIPREAGNYFFAIRAVSTSASPALAVTRLFGLRITLGRVNVITPTAEEGTTDVAVPAFPLVIDFVNPANPQAFFSWAFLVAGGSGDNVINIYLPRELELSVFDTLAQDAAGKTSLGHDTNEAPLSGNKFKVAFLDGGWFTAQAGNGKAQVGGFQSSRGPVLDSTTGLRTVNYFGAVIPVTTPPTPIPPAQMGLDLDYFQRLPGAGGPSLDSRRDALDTTGLAAGDTLLIPGRTIRFSNYFHPSYEGTDPGFSDPDPLNPPVLTRRKYPFTAAEYVAAFHVPFDAMKDLTPLKYYIIVEAIDRNFTAGDKSDDKIARKAYIVQIRIPDIVIETVFLVGGQAGVDYTPSVAVSGGVQPLFVDFSWVDPVQNMRIDSPSAISKGMFGLEINRNTGQFFGLPRAFGAVDLTVRAYAAIMNPVQNGPALVPTANAGEFVGTHPVTGLPGVHKTFAVTFLPPEPVILDKTGLNPAVDGVAYPGDQLKGMKGVAQLLPEPVGFPGTYSASTALRNYEFSTTYIRDTSHADVGASVAGLPNNLVLDGAIMSPTNGFLSGIANDRGFHPLSITIRDTYFGPASAPTLVNRLSAVRVLTMSISPDTVVYMRGVSSVGGNIAGLEDASVQMSLARNVPLAMAAGLLRVDTSKLPILDPNLPITVDILPLNLAHGGSVANIERNMPNLGGRFPAESNKEIQWLATSYYAWSHVAQELTYVQLHTPDHRRIYFWGQTQIKKFNASATTGQDSTRFQELRPTGKRGVLIMNHITGKYFIAASLDNNNPVHGTQFAGETVLSRGNELIYYEGTTYWKLYYYGQNDSRAERELQSQGLSAYIETPDSSSSNGWYRTSMGRSGISVAVSADGLWAATAMPGGTGPKILLFKTDGTSITGPLIASPNVIPLNGVSDSGAIILNSACIIDLRSSAPVGGVTFATLLDRQVLPDSLCFVQDGLLFLLEGNLNQIFGFSLGDGHFSSRLIPGASATTGQYIPDTDYLRAAIVQINSTGQFSFTGNNPPAGEEGPDKVAFVAGANAITTTLSDLGTRPRDGYIVKGNRNKSVWFLSLTKTAGTLGLDLTGLNALLTDLTAGSPTVLGGDVLPPGRCGEQMDFLKVSPDGRYVAVVRDNDIVDYVYYTSFFGTSTWTAYNSFATHQESGSSNWQANDDLLLFAVDPAEDLDTGTALTQNVLYFGSHSFVGGTATNPAGMPANASGRPHFNAVYRRVSGLKFGPNTGAGERSLIVVYAGDDSRHPKYNGWQNSGYVVNPGAISGWNNGTQYSVRIQFKTTGGVSPNMNLPATFMTNMMVGLVSTGVTGLGNAVPPFRSTIDSNQCFWVKFFSDDGRFLYYVSDQTTGRNFIVGFNLTTATINGRASYVPFTVHAVTVGLEQIDVNSFNYSNRFASVPRGVVNSTSGRDGRGIVFFIASKPTAGALSATDLTVFAFDSNIGGNAVELTSAVMTGTSNAINHLYPSADASVLLGLRTATTVSSRDNRGLLNGTSDLFAATNVHAALTGAPATSVIVSANMSHGNFMFIGEGTPAGVGAVAFSVAAASTVNTTLSTRRLVAATLSSLAPLTTLDSVISFYVVLASFRVLDDDATNAN